MPRVSKTSFNFSFLIFCNSCNICFRCFPGRNGNFKVERDSGGRKLFLEIILKHDLFEDWRLKCVQLKISLWWRERGGRIPSPPLYLLNLKLIGEGGISHTFEAIYIKVFERGTAEIISNDFLRIKMPTFSSVLLKRGLKSSDVNHTWFP